MEQLAAQIALEIEAIERDAHQQADNILRRADTEARMIVAAAERIAHDCAEQAAASAHSEAELGMRAAIGAQMETILDRLKVASFDAAQKLLEEDYPRCMASFIAMGASRVGSDQIDAEFPTHDRELFASHEAGIRKLIALQKITLGKSQCTISSRGGCIIYSTDRRRMHTATFEERFRRMEEAIRQELVTRLSNE
jgi:vacuolar-type H+-ATPase subunit E/Vma4